MLWKIGIICAGEKAVLKPYTLERSHDFFKDYVSDQAMTYDILLMIRRKSIDIIRVKYYK
jgi:hypothetical protein